MKRVALSAVIFLIAIGFVITLLEKTNVTHLFHSESSTAVKHDQKFQADKKAATIDSDGNAVSLDSKGNPVKNTGNYTPPSNSENISISANRQDDALVIGTKLAGYSDGTCDLELTSGALTIKRQVTVVYAPNYSTCAGFSIPTSELPRGDWKIMITVLSGGVTTSNFINHRIL